MSVPSYDDLARSIPDSSMREVLAQAGRLAPAPAADARRGAAEEPGTGGPSGLFACLRSPRTPEVIASVARDFSPRIERHGDASVVLDVSGLGRLLGDAQAIGAELERAVSARAAGVRVAIAPTQMAARLLAIGCSGLTVSSSDGAEALAALPVSVLRPLLDEGAARGTRRSVEATRAAHTVVDTFERWGLKTLCDVAALPPAGMSQRLGQEGVALQRLARGLDPSPLVPDPGVRRYLATLDLEWPIDTLEPLSFVLPRLLDPLSSALERADRGAAALRLDLRLTDKTTHARVLQLPAPMRDARVLRTLLLLDLESHPPHAAIDVITIEIDPAPGRIVQYSLLERATPSAETLATLMARLSALVGESRCGCPSLLDTHRPDGFEMRPPAIELPGATRRAPKQADGPGPSAMPVEALHLRRFRPPVAVRVTVEGGKPVHVAIDRRGMPGGPVTQAAGPWRSSGDWWDAATGWNRDEWDVSFRDGTLCRIYRDRAAGTWFMEGTLD